MYSPILAPLVVLVLWSFVMQAWLYATRIPAIIHGGLVYDPRRPAEDFHAQLPAAVRWKADNYNNLMEQPTLFYAVTLALALLGAGSTLRSPGSMSRCGSPTASSRRSSTSSCSAWPSSWQDRSCSWS